MNHLTSKLTIDAGKSTIGGQIMYLTGMVDKRTLEKYEREAREKNRESWYLSWALDTNQEGKSNTIAVSNEHFGNFMGSLPLNFRTREGQNGGSWSSLLRDREETFHDSGRTWTQKFRAQHDWRCFSGRPCRIG